MVVDPVTLAVVEILGSDSWGKIRDLLRRGDKNGASAQVDDAIAKIDADGVKRLDEQTKKDVRYQVLALASLEERPAVSAVWECPSPGNSRPRDYHRR
jgi:hypothetical protein